MTFKLLRRQPLQFGDTATCKKLYRELLTLVHGQNDIAERLITLEKHRNPGKLESWYLDKVIYDIRRGA